MKGGIIIWLALAVVLTPFIAYAAGTVIPQYDGYIVTSGSMEPEIQTGSLLFTYKTDAENIEVGDTITYRKNDNFITHEVIEKSNQTTPTFRTKGIANAAPDPGQVTPEMIQGKKLFSIPFLGYIAAWAGSTAGFLILVITPAIIIIATELRTIFKEIKTKKDREIQIGEIQ